MIDWQLQFTFDNFLRFSIHRLRYSTLFMSTTVCSSACRRYEPLIVAVTLSYILLYLVITCTGLYTVVTFYTSALYLYAFCIFPLQVLQQFILPFYVATYSGFFRGYVVAFLAFLQQFFKTFCSRFSAFSSSNIICYTYVLFPHGIYLLLVAI